MSHEIVGFAGRLDVLLPLRERWTDWPLFYLSPRQAFAFLPIPDWAEAEEAGLADKSLPDDFMLASDFAQKHVDNQRSDEVTQLWSLSTHPRVDDKDFPPLDDISQI